ncbi:hypothetical protein CONLIGDRAFT_681632 [Coniochaeta ligniaria NRRL 30616]|uniref:Uncharacterized protein n=1 Tax=Coniochaeta ligniaria NRRL 30616 TaxID=1408157 RepID=A0A1J7JG39_9PEZI|nr:hypothetical protein CONLIGDRAFT_681632 [Coniochaeta ligniaria NRRL 30616]
MAPHDPRHLRHRQRDRLVESTSPFWVDGFLFDGELRSQAMKAVLKSRAPLSTPDDDLGVVIKRNLILLFRLINFYLAFEDRPYFLAIIATDIGWNQSHCANIINRYEKARRLFSSERPKATNARTAPYKWTESRRAYLGQVREAWSRAAETDIEAILDAAPNLPAPPPFPDWIQIGSAGLQAVGPRRSRSPPPPLRQQPQAERQRRFRSRSPIRQAVNLPVRPSPGVEARRLREAREQAEAEQREARARAEAEKRAEEARDLAMLADLAKRLQTKTEEFASREGVAGERKMYATQRIRVVEKHHAGIERSITGTRDSSQVAPYVLLLH